MSFSLTGVTFFMFAVLVIAALGYGLGRITVKGISLGTAGVFIAAILFGCLFYGDLAAQLPEYTKNALKIIENLGLILFVTSVGFIAGPRFFGNMKRNFKSYVLLGFVVILAGGLTAVGCIYLGRMLGETDHAGFTAMVVGLFSGSLTSTPAFSAAKDTVAAQYESLVSVGYGIAYLFGVVGVVLFVQLMPRIEKADMDVERSKLVQVSAGEEKKKYDGKLINIDGFGFAVFAIAAAIGIVVGKVSFGTFALTTTGGCLLVSLIFGHFGRCGRINLIPSIDTLKNFREFGLVLFLTGAGISGGAEFVAVFKPIYFIYGVIMTTCPMIIGYFFAKHVLKMSLLNTLGSLTGGMTSTPALGTLINVAKTEEIAAAYAATYPIALISIVFVTQFIIILFS